MGLFIAALLTEEGVQDLHGGRGLDPFRLFAGGDVDEARSAAGGERGNCVCEDGSPSYGGDGIVEDEVGGFDGGGGRLLGRCLLGGSHCWRIFWGVLRRELGCVDRERVL